jgi:ATP-dependent helicase HrpB
MPRSPLPIDAALSDLVRAVGSAHAAVVCAPTGSGKTSRVPPALLDEVEGVVVVLEPRRVAARAAARWMAAENGWKLGRVVGYQVRFERRASAHTRILVVTEGILVRMLADDPLLEGIGAVVLDEFHERSLDADLCLAMARHVQQQVRPDLALVVMSATVESGPVARFLGGCPVVTASGRAYPVEIQYLRTEPTGPIEERVRGGVQRVLDAGARDVLVFLPGVGEIRRSAEALEALAAREGLAIQPLYGDLPGAQQDAVLRPGPSRRVVLATNVAETSLTIPGIDAVVDTGYERAMRHDLGLGLDRLEMRQISQASAIQRAGRAGRTGPGICLRLWTAAAHPRLPERADPEIRRVDLAGTVLQLIAWGERPGGFGWLDAPSRESLDRAEQLLTLLGALVDGELTGVGRAMAGLPLHPRLARLVLAGARYGHGRCACRLAAVLAERSPIRLDRPRDDRGPRWSSRSDVLDRLSAVDHVADPREPTPYARAAILQGVARRAIRAGQQIERRLGSTDAVEPVADREEALLRAVALAWPDRLARRREPRSSRALMLGGLGVRQIGNSGLLDDELFVCVDLSSTTRSGDRWVHMASAVERAWLPDGAVARRTVVRFDAEAQRVIVRDEEVVGDLVLAARTAPEPRPGAVAAELERAAAGDLTAALGLAEPAPARLLSRWRFLRRARPTLDLPDPDELLRQVVLPTLCVGRASFADLRRASVASTLLGALEWKHRASLDHEAPERWKVPGGRHAELQYPDEGPPVLAARIQELFGLAEAPYVAGGRVQTLLHLLAPNGRPQQVTSDLGSFWENTYPQVRKELRARYPKHDWPEDPWDAEPRSAVGRRKRRR